MGGFLGGFTQAVGAGLQEREYEKRQHRQAVSDEQLRNHVGELYRTMDAVRTDSTLSQPEKDARIADIQREITNAYGGPIKTPQDVHTRLYDLLHHIRGKQQPMGEQIPGVGGTPANLPAMRLPATSAEGSSIPGDVIPAARQAAPSYRQRSTAEVLALGGGTPPPSNAFELFLRDPDRFEKYQELVNQGKRGQWETVSATFNSQPVLLRHNKADDSWTDQAGQPINDLTGYVLQAKQTGRPRQLWRQQGDGSWSSWNLDSNNQPIESSRLDKATPPSGYLQRTSSGQAFITDSEGNVHEIPKTTTSGPVIPGAGVAKNAGEAKKAAAGTAPAKTFPQPKGDHIVAYKGSDEYKALKKSAAKAKTDYNNVETYVSAMEKNAEAAKRGEGPAQVAIVAGYIKSQIGGTGIRVTQTEWNQAVQTAPLLQRIEAHFTPDGFLASTSAISVEQIDQMIAVTKNKATALKENVGRMEQEAEQVKASDTRQQPKTSPSGKWNPQTGRYE